MSELKVVETIATLVETDSREVGEKAASSSTFVSWTTMEYTSTYIVTQKLDPESLILNRTQVIICSHRLLLLHRHGTCCSRFQRPDAGPRNKIDVVNFTSESYHLFLESICDESGIWSFAGNWGVEQVAQGHHLFPKYAQRRSNYSELMPVLSSRIPHQSENFDCVLLHTWGNESFVGWVLHFRPQPYSISLLPSFPVVEEPLRNTKTGA